MAGTRLCAPGAGGLSRLRPPPLALYVHWPWCLSKCPYCDFNSHPAPDPLPQATYVDALLADLDAELAIAPLAGSLGSLFIGGGTPSLLDGRELARLLDGVRARVGFRADAEFTLEANPGALDARGLAQSIAAGINRLSLGVQSLSDAGVRALGRLHDAEQARAAVALARRAGCTNLNLDLMYGLPGQSLAAARADLDAALALEPEHLSYYQLTLEPGTAFARAPPPLPEEDLLADIAEQGQALLAEAGFVHYEVSAHAQAGRECRHNVNYWTFGDYLGIGAGAHGKRTEVGHGRVTRQVKWPDPARYLAAHALSRTDPAAFIAEQTTLTESDLVVEFALNALRLRAGVPLACFVARTGLAVACLEPGCARARALGLIDPSTTHLRASARGRRFLNALIGCFLPD